MLPTINHLKNGKDCPKTNYINVNYSFAGEQTEEVKK